MAEMRKANAGCTPPTAEDDTMPTTRYGHSLRFSAIRRLKGTCTCDRGSTQSHDNSQCKGACDACLGQCQRHTVRKALWMPDAVSRRHSTWDAGQTTQ